MTSARLGEEELNAEQLRGQHWLFLAPYLPSWDQGAFFEPLAALLRERGHRINFVDTVEPVGKSVHDFAALVAYWRARIDFSEFDLLAGNALGGAVLQALLEDSGVHLPVVLFSSPTVADPVLVGKLNAIVELNRSGNAEAAHQLLTQLIAPGTTGSAPLVESNEAQLTESSSRSNPRTEALSFFQGLELSGAVANYDGRILSIVGELSQLVTREHLRRREQDQSLEVARAGMRAHQQEPEFLREKIEQFINEH
ncbi:hypothetical protein [Psychromicrobium lacuslunae]|uniref:Alpha/beta hydrolase n=1 Tax=Psychromicrobium lacuslunae TaxID=1618207 RepID=A0A0D4BZH0_9MICC|nr:hypothetical protein [Psychromicrobium lacuslunae]AJT41723.1 hypothetical protein UM93_09735 [Psychromicrobium lacuslunae]